MGKIVSRIVLTGGPRGGKTTILSKVEENLAELGYHIIVVPESATELINGGIRPFGDYPIGMLDFQSLIIDHQLAKEELFERAVSYYPETDKFIMIYDRGVIDNKAYINQEQFDYLLKERALKELNLMDKYDIILHLVTSADSNEGSYTTTDNVARSEDATRAVEVDRKLLKAWSGHSNIRVIDSVPKFEDKIQNVLNEINNLMGNPVTIKAQRRYLVDLAKSNLDFLNTNSPIKMEIKQIYLESNNELENRLRKRTYAGVSTYFLTVKRKGINGMEEIIKSKKISEKDYYRYSDENKIKCIVNITRYSFIMNKQYFKLDIFEDGLAILEVLPTIENNLVNIPENIKVIEEVTNNPLYNTINLGQKSKVYIHK